MKIATWNVNGIRAREAQVCEWLEREQPDVVCLQEIKAEPAQVPERCKLADYHAFWHGGRGYSGVSLHVRRPLLDAEPQWSHPPFDMETRIVQIAFGNWVVASVYVPNGGKDYAAKLSFFEALVAWARELHDQGRELVICGDLNIARLVIDVHPKERKEQIIGQRPEERELFDGAARRPDGRRRTRRGSRQRPLVQLVAAVAQHASAQHRLAHRLHPSVEIDRRTRDELRRAVRRGHQRSRAGGHDARLAVQSRALGARVREDDKRVTASAARSALQCTAAERTPAAMRASAASRSGLGIAASCFTRA